MCPDTNSPEDSGRSYDGKKNHSPKFTNKNHDTGAYKPHECPLNRSCRAECRAWQGSRGPGGSKNELPPALRWFAEHHKWHDPGHLANQLKILLVFKKPVRAAANKLLAVGLDGLAGQIKKEFKRLLEMCQPLDAVCGKRIVEEDEAMKLEHTRAYLTESLVELAELIESGQSSDLSNQKKPRKTRSSQKIVDIPPAEPKPLRPDGHLPLAGEEQWITVTAAAKMLGKNRGTISHWAKIGKIRDNGKKNHQRRILKTDILLIREAAEAKDRQKDMDDLRDDSRRIK